MKVFIVEDDELYANVLMHYLKLNPDYEVEIYSEAKQFLKNLYKNPSVVLLDFTLPDMNGFEVLKRIKAIHSDLPIVIISGQEDVLTAVKLLKSGVYDYIVKNSDTKEKIWNILHNINQKIEMSTEIETLKQEVVNKYQFNRSIKGNSPFIKSLYSLIEKASRTNITVSIYGETGTGKELVAKAIHYNSNRSKKPFIAINVSAIPKELIESELFGYEKGAFTGANARKIGKFEEANKGTIFLDEIGEMDTTMQAKILRVLQERELTRVAGNEVIKIDTRIIVSTNKNLAKEVHKGNFREDLYYRLLGLPIEMLPLRYRGNDVLVLALHFLSDFCKDNKMKIPTLSADAQTKLCSYNYPGNIRELKSIVDLAAVLCNGNKINKEDIVFANTVELSEFSPSEGKTLHEYTLDIVRYYLNKYDKNILKVAEKLDIGKSTIYRMLKNKEI